MPDAQQGHRLQHSKVWSTTSVWIGKLLTLQCWAMTKLLDLQVKPSGRPENFPVAKEAMPWPIASVASLGKSPKKPRSSPKARHSRVDSLPEVSLPGLHAW